jgi:ubiquinone/menaquinone biosynthesis C-methylase UbiE
MIKQLKQALLVDEHVCPTWLAGPLENPLRRFIHNPDKIFSGLISQNQTVVDVGCGPGFFSVGMAKLVGDEGRVIAVDLQQQMLNRVRRRARQEGVESRLQFHHGPIEGLDYAGQIDFGLAFWMVHEVPDKPAFLQTIRRLLKPGAHFLLVEPLIHVSAPAFQHTVELARAAGLTLSREPSIRLSRTVLLKK